MRDIGTLGGINAESYAYGINAAGEVVGMSADETLSERAFVYSNGTMQDLNSLIDPILGWN